MTTKTLHVETPIVENTILSNYLNAKVFLKLDNTQPSGSFKIRGIGHCCSYHVHKNNCKRFIACSGGNAGLAVAYSGRKLGIPVTVVLPSTTPKFMRERIEMEGAKVEVHGNVFDEANEYALQLAANDKTSALIHAFDDPLLWEGHSTIITECAKQMPKPDVIITVVGGGGLLAGVLIGCKKVGWEDVPIIASETIGADSFHQAFKKGELVTLPEITSLAVCLGAKTVCSEVLELSKKANVTSVTVSDKLAIKAISRFADDAKYLVEPSCGAGLAVIYEKHPELMKIIGGKKDAKVLVLVCGGNIVSLKQLEEWKQKFNL